MTIYLTMRVPPVPRFWDRGLRNCHAWADPKIGTRPIRCRLLLECRLRRESPGLLTIEDRRTTVSCRYGRIVEQRPEAAYPEDLREE